MHTRRNFSFDLSLCWLTIFILELPYHWLLDLGYLIYLLDPICRDRPPYHPFSGRTGTYPADMAEKRWTACRDFMLRPEAALHTQWPGSGRMRDPIFDAHFASRVLSLADYGVEQAFVQTVGASLLDRIGLDF